MAKKVVATLHTKGKDKAKVIKMVRSPKTGAYIFQDAIILNDQVKEFLNKK